MLAALFARLRRFIVRWFRRREVPARVPESAPPGPPAEWLARRESSPPPEWLARVSHVTWQSMRAEAPLPSPLSRPAPPADLPRPPAAAHPVIEGTRSSGPDAAVEWPAIAAWDLRHHWHMTPTREDGRSAIAPSGTRHDDAPSLPRRVPVSAAFGDPAPLSRRRPGGAPSLQTGRKDLDEGRAGLTTGSSTGLLPPTATRAAVPPPKTDGPPESETPRRRRTDLPPAAPVRSALAPQLEDTSPARAIGDDLPWPELPLRPHARAGFDPPERSTTVSQLWPEPAFMGEPVVRPARERFSAPAYAATAAASDRTRPADDTGESPSMWPALPERPASSAPADPRETLTHLRRQQRLDREQRGDVWNAWPS